MKKLIALVMAGVMVAAVGCSSKTTNTTPAPATNEAATTETQTTETTGAEDTTATDTATTEAASGDLVTIRMSATGDFQWKPEDKLVQYIEDKFGIRFESTQYDEDPDKILLEAAGGTLADVLYSSTLYDLYHFAKMIDEGYYRSIPEDMINKYPNVKNLIETSDVGQAVQELYGEQFMLPKPDSRVRGIYVTERKGIFYRKDWLANVGITKEPTNFKELYEMAKAFTLNDPNKSGKNDTYGLTSDGFGNFRYFFASYGQSNLDWAKGPDGVWTHGALMQSNVEGLEWFRKMYEEGYLDPEFASTDHVQAVQKFASEIFGAVNRNADTDWIYNVVVKDFYAATQDKYPNPFDVVGVIPIIAKDENTDPALNAYQDMTGVHFSYNCTDEKLDKYLAFHDWSISDEGERFWLGFEGEDYNVDSSGKITLATDESGAPHDLGTLYPSMEVIKMGSWGFHMAADPNWPIYTYGTFNDAIKSASKEARDKRNPYPMKADMRVKLIPLPSMLDANSFKFSVEYANIVMGKEPVQKMFDDMVAKAMASGFTEAMKDVNDYIAEKGW